MLQFSEKLLNNLMQIGLTVSLAALVPLILRRKFQIVAAQSIQATHPVLE